MSRLFPGGTHYIVSVDWQHNYLDASLVVVDFPVALSNSAELRRQSGIQLEGDPRPLQSLVNIHFVSQVATSAGGGVLVVPWNVCTVCLFAIARERVPVGRQGLLRPYVLLI